MKAEDVKVGMRVVQSKGPNTVEHFAVFSEPVSGLYGHDHHEHYGLKDYVLARRADGSDGWFWVFRVDDIEPVPEYCAVYADLDGKEPWTGLWRNRKVDESEDCEGKSNSVCLGHFVRDTPDSKPRWEPAS